MESVSLNGDTNILTIKDPSNYTLEDAVDSLTSRYLSFQVRKCENSTSRVQCADFGKNNEKLKAYLARFSFGILSLIN